MKDLHFEWDPAKADANLSKHGISFEEAATAFYDSLGFEFYDEGNSEWEDRFLLLGMSSNFRLLLVCHCYRQKDSVIRIISARKATKNESRHYHR